MTTMKCGPDNCPLTTFSDLTPAEQREQRARKAKEMSDRGFTEQQIAKQFGVDRSTISRDLSEFVHDAQIKKPSKTATNPKGAGRPKGRSRPPRKNESEAARAAAFRIIDQGENYDAIERETGLSNTVLRSAVAREEGRREPQMDKADLPLTAQQKLDTAIRVAKQKLEIEFSERARLEAIRIVDEMLLPHYTQVINETYEKIVGMRFKGLMTKDTYRKLKACLHPDRVSSELKPKYEEAFRLFTEMEPALLSEADSPTIKPTLPTTYAEFMERKAKAAESRKRKSSTSGLKSA